MGGPNDSDVKGNEQTQLKEAGLLQIREKSHRQWRFARSQRNSGGFGCHGEVVTHAEDVAPAMQRALTSGLPAVLDCRTRFVPHPASPMFGSMNKYGFDALKH